MTSVTTIQKLHALPYAKIYGMLEYKLAMHGITLAKQTEEYSSQRSPHAPQVTKEYAKKCNRTNRGLYKVFYLKQSPKFLEISNALCYIEYKERHLLEQMPFSSDSIHSKSGCSQVCILLL